MKRRGADESGGKGNIPEMSETEGTQKNKRINKKPGRRLRPARADICQA